MDGWMNVSLSVCVGVAVPDQQIREARASVTLMDAMTITVATAMC